MHGQGGPPLHDMLSSTNSQSPQASSSSSIKQAYKLLYNGQISMQAATHWAHHMPTQILWAPICAQEIVSDVASTASNRQQVSYTRRRPIDLICLGVDRSKSSNCQICTPVLGRRNRRTLLFWVQRFLEYSRFRIAGVPERESRDRTFEVGGRPAASNDCWRDEKQRYSRQQSWVLAIEGSQQR